MKDWEVVLKVKHPQIGRPRRLSIHSIASVCQRDPLVILKEMEDSGVVSGFTCHTEVFFFKEFFGTYDNKCFDRARELLKQHPIEKYHGFSYKTRKAVKYMFAKVDKEYGDLIKKALKEFRAKEAGEKAEPKKETVKTDWQVVMSVRNPNENDDFGGGRPRRMSIHTIAAMCGRDPFQILKEMKESGLVVGYRCPDVQCTIFYLKELAGLPKMIDSRSADCWDTALNDLKNHPFPETKGFARDETIGDVKYVVKGQKYAMTVPFVPKDKPLEDAIADKVMAFKKEAAGANV